MVKYNNGNGAIICNVCRVIIKAPISYEEFIREQEREHICTKCKEAPHDANT